MRRSIAGLAVLTTLLPAAAGADTLPPRKSGLWESKSVSAEGSTTVRQCIDAKTDQLAQSAVGGGPTCAKRVLTKTSTGYASETECKMGPISAAGKGTITGDFGSRIRIETNTVLTGLPNEKGPVTRNTVIEATWIGPCESGQSPGDIILSDGKIVKTPGVPR